MWISDLRRFTVYPQSSLTITKTQAVALDALKFSIHFKILSAPSCSNRSKLVGEHKVK